MKKILHLLIVSSFLASCQKQPTASFTTDKSIYYAGETVHLTDASTNAHHWQWTMPNGTSNINSKNADYIIPADDLGGNETFYLKVTSRYNSLNSSISKSVDISQPILGSDYYSIDTVTYLPIYKFSKAINNHWAIINYNKIGYVENLCGIYFSNNTAPIQSATYATTTNFPPQNGQVYLEIKRGLIDAGSTYTA